MVALGSALAEIGAVLAVVLAGLGSGLGQGIAAAGSVGTVAENRDTFARGFVFTVMHQRPKPYMVS